MVPYIISRNLKRVIKRDAHTGFIKNLIYTATFRHLQLFNSHVIKGRISIDLTKHFRSILHFCLALHYKIAL